MSPAAKRDDWKTLPMPSETANLAVHLSLSSEELQILARGHIPADMDDKWFIYQDGDDLWFHRSWTGICIYRATVVLNAAGGGAIVSATVNRNVEQYQATDEAYDARLMMYLVERSLLGRDVEFPAPESTDAIDVYRHHVVGSADRK